MVGSPRTARTRVYREQMKMLTTTLGLPGRASDLETIAKATAVIRVYHHKTAENNDTPVGFQY